MVKHVDGYDAMKKAQVQRRSGEEFSKETTKMKMNPKKPIEKETGVEEEDDLVAYTADYWKPRHHPPKNNWRDLSYIYIKDPTKWSSLLNINQISV